MLNSLVKLILLEKQDIVSSWVKHIKAMGGSYTQMNTVEQSDLCTEFLDAFSEILGDGNFLKMRMLIEKISQLRSGQGYRLSEVQRAYYSFFTIMRPLIIKQESKGGNVERTLNEVSNILLDVLFELSESFHKRLNEKIDSYIDNVQQANLQLRETSIRDELTGCYNQRYFHNTLDAETARSKRYQRPLSMIMFDVDNLNDINDTYDATVGDGILKRIGEILRKTVRTSDMAFRYTGKSFGVILPETKKEKAFVFAERIRSAIAETVFEVQQRNLKVTLSAGVNGGDEGVEDKYTLLSDTDKALQQAQEKGGNVVVLS